MSKDNQKPKTTKNLVRDTKLFFLRNISLAIGLGIFVIVSLLGTYLYNATYDNADAAITCSLGTWDGTNCTERTGKLTSTIYTCPDGSAPNGSNQCGAGQNYLWRCDGRANELFLLSGDWAGGAGNTLSLCTSNTLSQYFLAKTCQYSYGLFDAANGGQYSRADRFNAAFNYDASFTSFAAGGYNGQSASGAAFCEGGNGCPSGMRAIFGEASKRYGTSGGSYGNMQLLCVTIALIGATDPNSPLFTIAGGRDGSYVEDRKCGDNPGGGAAPLSGYNGSITIVGDQFGNDHQEVVWLCARGGFTAPNVNTTQYCPSGFADGGADCYRYGTVTGYVIDSASVGTGVCTPSSTTQGVNLSDCTFPLTSPTATTFVAPVQGLYAGILNTNGDTNTYLGNSTLCTVNNSNSTLQCLNVPIPNNTNIGSRELIIHQPGIAYFSGKGAVGVGAGVCGNGALGSSFPTCNVCPSGQFYNPIGNANTCVTQCPSGSFGNTLTNTCVASCPSGTITNTLNNTCVASCPSGTLTNLVNNTCVSTCPSGTLTDTVNNTCVASCPSGTFTHTVNNTCVAQCPSGFIAGTNATCYPTNCVASASTCLITTSTIVNSTVCVSTFIVVIPQNYTCTFPLFGNTANNYTLPQQTIKAATATTATGTTLLANSFSDNCTITGNGTANVVLTCANIKTTGATDGLKNVLITFDSANPVDKGDVDLFDPAGDRDNDGIPNTIECNATATSCPDTDNDTIPNWKDSDSDNDGIPDSIEKGSTCASTTNCVPANNDSDTLSDYIDSDSDGDGIPDSIEKGSTCATLAACVPVDTDNDTKPDYIDTDSDGDGIPDSIEGRDNAGNPTGTVTTPVDTDNNNKPDYIDSDSDGDGILDFVEKGSTCALLTSCVPKDTDSDGVPDYRQAAISLTRNISNSADCTATLNIIVPNTYTCTFPLTGNKFNSYSLPTNAIIAYTATDTTGITPLANSGSSNCTIISNNSAQAALKCSDIKTLNSTAGLKNVLLSTSTPINATATFTAADVVVYVDKGDVNIIIPAVVRSGGNYIISIVGVSLMGIFVTGLYYFSRNRKLKVQVK